jgi:hypothetical protein
LREAMRLELLIWREALTLQDIQKLCKDKNNGMTVAVLAAGVGVCTYSSVVTAVTREKIIRTLNQSHSL